MKIFFLITVSFTVFFFSSCKKESNNEAVQSSYFISFNDGTDTKKISLKPPNEGIGEGHLYLGEINNSSFTVTGFDNSNAGNPILFSIIVSSKGPLPSGIGSYYFGYTSSQTFSIFYTKGSDQYITDVGSNNYAFPNNEAGKVTIVKISGKVVEGSFTANVSIATNTTIKKTIAGTFKVLVD